MVNDVKPTHPFKLNDDEVDDEVVNDSLGEVTPADSTGLNSKGETRKREHGT